MSVTVSDGAQSVTRTTKVFPSGTRPSVADLALSQETIDQGGSVTLSGRAVGEGERVVEVVWAPGVTDTLHLASDAESFSFTRTFQASGALPLTVTVTDAKGATTILSARVGNAPTLTVKNVAPTLSVVSLDRGILTGAGTATITGTAGDAGGLDHLTVRLTWSDGVQSLAEVDGKTGTFTGLRAFTLGEALLSSRLTVDVVAIDDVGATSEAESLGLLLMPTAIVEPPAPTIIDTPTPPVRVAPPPVVQATFGTWVAGQVVAAPVVPSVVSLGVDPLVPTVVATSGQPGGNGGTPDTGRVQTGGTTPSGGPSQTQGEGGTQTGGTGTQPATDGTPPAGETKPSETPPSDTPTGSGTPSGNGTPPAEGTPPTEGTNPPNDRQGALEVPFDFAGVFAAVDLGESHVVARAEPHGGASLVAAAETAVRVARAPAPSASNDNAIAAFGVVSLAALKIVPERARRGRAAALAEMLGDDESWHTEDATSPLLEDWDDARAEASQRPSRRSPA